MFAQTRTPPVQQLIVIGPAAKQARSTTKGKAAHGLQFMLDRGIRPNFGQAPNSPMTPDPLPAHLYRPERQEVVFEDMHGESIPSRLIDQEKQRWLLDEGARRFGKDMQREAISLRGFQPTSTPGSVGFANGMQMAARPSTRHYGIDRYWREDGRIVKPETILTLAAPPSGTNLGALAPQFQVERNADTRELNPYRDLVASDPHSSRDALYMRPEFITPAGPYEEPSGRLGTPGSSLLARSPLEMMNSVARPKISAEYSRNTRELIGPTSRIYGAAAFRVLDTDTSGMGKPIDRSTSQAMGRPGNAHYHASGNSMNASAVWATDTRNDTVLALARRAPAPTKQHQMQYPVPEWFNQDYYKPRVGVQVQSHIDPSLSAAARRNPLARKVFH